MTDGAQPDPREQPLGEAVALLHRQDRADRDRPEQAEVARAVVDVDLGHRVHDLVEAAGEAGARPGVARAVAAGHDLVGALLEELEHPGQQVRRVLQVGVHDGHRSAARVAEAREHGRLLAEVAAQGQVAHPWVALGGRLDEVEGGVGAAVVDDQDLEVRVASADRRALRVEGGQERLDDARLVEAGDHDRQLHAAIVPAPRPIRPAPRRWMTMTDSAVDATTEHADPATDPASASSSSRRPPSLRTFRRPTLPVVARPGHPRVRPAPRPRRRRGGLPHLPGPRPVVRVG